MYGILDTYKGNEMRKKVVVYGFGDFAITMFEVINLAKQTECEIDWGIILPTMHFYKKWESLLPVKDILVLPDKRNTKFAEFPMDKLACYSGSFYNDLETDKNYFVNKSATWREINGAQAYQAYKEFLTNDKPYAIIFPALESVDGVILSGLCRELDIIPMIYTHTRCLEKSFWALNQNEKLPSNIYVTEELLEEAKGFLHRYRSENISANSYFPQYSGVDAELITIEVPKFTNRIWNYMSRIIKDPNQRTILSLKVSTLNNLPLIRDTIWRIRKENNKKYFQLSSINELPERFIFYPLQYSPESSINVPAPYFADQRRAIDLIRMNMPSNYILVVKEHPACITIRNRGFIKSLMKLPGLRVARYDLSTAEIMKRCSLVMSVTGTATLEAFLTGKPSLTLGETFFSDFLGGVAGTTDIKDRIYKKLNEKIDDKYIVECIAKIFSACQGFTIRSINEAPTLFKGNIKAILNSIEEKLEK